MRNALLFLAVTLTILYMVGGPDSLAEALIRLFVLGGIQVITHFLNRTNDRRRALKQAAPQRLRKGERRDINSGPI